MSAFDKFDKEIGKDYRKKIEEAKENAGGYEEVPAGKYVARIESMELGQTKDKRPMFKVQMRLVDGEGTTEKEFLSKYTKKKPCVFMNRVMYGTKNDPAMIASVEGWLGKLEFDPPIVFTTYSQFADELLDAAEECEHLEMVINYDPEAFNNISIEEVYDV